MRGARERAGIGVGRTGGAGENWSGDIFLAFSTGNRGLPNGDYGAEPPVEVPLAMVSNAHLDPFYDAVIEATEEAIINALVAAETRRAGRCDGAWSGRPDAGPYRCRRRQVIGSGAGCVSGEARWGRTTTSSRSRAKT